MSQVPPDNASSAPGLRVRAPRAPWRPYGMTAAQKLATNSRAP
jgi:hypothetical protein